MAPELPQVFGKYADEVIRGAGLARRIGDDVREELVAHLATAWEAEVARGAKQEDAAARALQACGDVAVLQRKFFLARVRAVTREAAQFSSLLRGLIALDVTAGLVWFSLYLNSLPLGWFDRAATSVVAALTWTVMLLAAWFLARLGLRLIFTRSVSLAGTVEAVAGVGAVAFALGEVLQHEPSVIAMTLSRLTSDPAAWRAAWHSVAHVSAGVALACVVLRAVLASQVFRQRPVRGRPSGATAR